MLSISGLLATTICLSYFRSVSADDSVSFNATTYGLNDTTPYQTFRSNTQVRPPELLINLNESSAISDGYVLFGVFGTPSAGDVGAVPFMYNMSPGDDLGTLLWAGIGYGNESAGDVAIQTYRGEPVISFWQGQIVGTGHGTGSYYILGQNYSQIAHIQAVGFENAGDVHEFFITTDDTAVVTIYWAKEADLTSVNGSAEGWILECSFQEFDIETGDLIFMWNASDHLSVQQTYSELAAGSNGTEAYPFDWFHINSVQKDGDGNYLISSRHLWSLFKIDSKTGDIIWTLGGKGSEFDIPQEADFHWQHHARWIEPNSRTHLSVWANMGTVEDTEDTYSRGILMVVDEDSMTVSFVQDYHNTKGTWSKGQGSFQCLNFSDIDTTNFFLGYGAWPYFTELTNDGTVVLDAEFAVSDNIQSYRTFKYPPSLWVGRPLTNPDIFWNKSEQAVYLSWNGATEISTWQLYAAASINSSNWIMISSSGKTGFETVLNITMDKDNLWIYVKAKALDVNGADLGWTSITDGTNLS